jgi:hypothetical protein
MLQDLAALTPPLIVCVAFLVGVGVLVRRELAPKWRARKDPGESGPGESVPAGRGIPGEPETAPDRGDGSQT